MKLSALFFFRRIFFVEEPFCRFNNTMIVSAIAQGLAFMFAEIFVCGANPEVLWDLNTGSPERCVNQTWLNLVFSITDVIEDILVMAMPYPYIRKLNVSLRERLWASLLSFSWEFISRALTFDYGSDANHHGEGTPPTGLSIQNLGSFMADSFLGLVYDRGSCRRSCCLLAAFGSSRS